VGVALRVGLSEGMIQEFFLDVTECVDLGAHEGVTAVVDVIVCEDSRCVVGEDADLTLDEE
jgi:hypothetical protein